MKTRRPWAFFHLWLLPVFMTVAGGFLTANAAVQATFSATGPTKETKLLPDRFLGAVKVTFDLLPTTMSFDLPWHFCAVSENGLKIAHFAAETYDPREWDGTGADASFEAGMDKEGRYARVWIEHQSAARIVVRVRYALTNSKYKIAHDDLATGSPYNNGKGDWAEEWFTIYPDGTHVRHMRIHTALAAMSQPFSFFREPPNVVHEFMETIVIGPKGHVPTDDIATDPTLTLFKMFGTKPGTIFAGGSAKDIACKMPAGPPGDYGEFRDANIMLLHTKSKYRAFTIGLPYGVQVQPYGWEKIKTYPFATWTGYDEPSIGYVSAIGHLINYWHYRRTETTIEQVFLHGMTGSEKPQSDILKLAWSWVSPPELQMPDAKKSPNESTGKYNVFTYDQAQKAYVVPRKNTGPEQISFALRAIYDDSNLEGTMWLVNPAIVVPNWNQATAPFTLKINDTALVNGTDYRVGYERTAAGTDLVLWLNKTYDLTNAAEHQIAVSIIP
jgi:hypothetical protein